MTLNEKARIDKLIQSYRRYVQRGAESIEEAVRRAAEEQRRLQEESAKVKKEEKT